MTMVEKCDKLFGKFIKQRDGHACQWPGCDRYDLDLQCHHLITRTYRKTRFEPDNGITLCRAHHMFVTHRPLENLDFAFSIIGEERYWELKHQAQSVVYKVDLAEVLAELKGKVAA